MGGRQMAARKAKLTKRTVDAAQPEAARYAIHDSEISGFKVYVSTKGQKAFYLRYRVGGGRGATIREPKIGDHGALTVDAARQIATDWVAEVRAGGDPGADRQKRREAPRMNELFDRYLEEHARVHKKASSARHDEGNTRKYLRPSLGSKKVAELTRDDVAALHGRLSETPYQANRVLALLSKAMNFAEVWGWRPEGTNPCRHVKKFPEAKRKRFLSPMELGALGEGLRRAEAGELGAMMPSAVAAIRLLILTGARSSEIVGLRWDWIDFDAGRASLPDSKTGEKIITLPPAALEVLAAIPRVESNPHVIVGAKPGASLVNLKRPWSVIREAAGLSDLRIHDLRHSFASVGAAGGMSLPIIGALLGHSQAATTQRYAHLSDDPLQTAAAQISGQVAAAMAGGSGEVLPLRKSK